VVAEGAGAIIALAKAIGGKAGMDFGDQVLLVTERPGERQLFGLACALSGSRSKARTLAPDRLATDAEELGFKRATVLLVSDDASAPARDTAQRLYQELSR
jgi:hypothetical protein